MGFFRSPKLITSNPKSVDHDLVLSLSDKQIITPYFIQQFLAQNGLYKKIKKDTQNLDIHHPGTMRAVSTRIMSAIMRQPLGNALCVVLAKVGRELNPKDKSHHIYFRLFFTNPEAGNYHILAQNEFLVTKKNLEQAFKKAVAQFYSADILLDRERSGFGHLDVGLALIVYTRSVEARHFVLHTSQREIESNIASLYIEQKTGKISEYLLFKPNLTNGEWPILNSLSSTTTISTPILNLVARAVAIETTALASLTVTGYFDQTIGNISLVGLEKNTPIIPRDFSEEFVLTQKAKPIMHGKAVGKSIAVGLARIINQARDYQKYQPGEIIVAKKFSPECLPLATTAVGFIFESSHLPIEFITQIKNFNRPCIVNVKHTMIKSGASLTLSCAQGEDGLVYAGALPYEVKKRIASRPHKTKIELAEAYNALPTTDSDSDRVIFIDDIIAGEIKIHPLSLCQNQSSESREKYLTAIFSVIAQATALNYPHSLTVALSSASRRVFENLVKGKNWEKKLKLRSGARGAERYLASGYVSVVAAECQVLIFLKEKLGLKNLRLQLPYCRSPFELEKFLALLESHGITRAKGWKFSLQTNFPGHGLLTESFALQVDTLILDIDALVPAIMGERVTTVTPEMQKIVENVLVQIVRTARKVKTDVAVSGMLLSRQPKLVFSTVKSGVKSVLLTSDHASAVRASIIEAEQTVGNTGYATNHRWLGLVAGIAAFGALLMTGAGCGMNQLVYPEQAGGERSRTSRGAEIPQMTPAQIRAEILSSISIAQEELSKKTLTESIVNGFAHFKIAYPKSWIAEYQPDNFILTDAETSTTIRFYQKINSDNSTTSTSAASLDFIHEVSMPNNSVLQIFTSTSSQVVNDIIDSVKFLQ
ncbi:MAG: hypothetical protein A2821_03625 [Candidatus Magasanikbacteria bacterium RIFCSPHIGHO2_01_FULL_41_23]|uniref:Uncharacterized protein n=1 Tax=Candidatus Magasanikbacteria bacterium RIFCSPLOWO2_01_FULL_40_15 TaxID=1798686 RepID=A0A1F6N1Q9_9BACT|nr:MAG: hypothetical protein A2821_03625 [Candidatus Magasanikbacteria bacterium RIFCSPHIGHO2_01_FULL_41_23]OGH67247.1 MAG: hypothetical protein A3C66_00700 [Candidatus Magasanikbacteria bacterium RIFCSPHIGHO2_02_FULL_41_35]OGH76649.1 MAG: hypothetical protein A3F22_03700 [Candidatus Magasanikbacteria bacterium RIFCSPHIGHO2_12_FULL_41_16]OGH77814.1 MAG: hypothetical protein A2983_00250 [Candidatus Magasanikbacteria bacterium RIFCSPLOWO2_01_FULL_40_15]